MLVTFTRPHRFCSPSTAQARCYTQTTFARLSTPPLIRKSAATTVVRPIWSSQASASFELHSIAVCGWERAGAHRYVQKFLPIKSGVLRVLSEARFKRARNRKNKRCEDTTGITLHPQLLMHDTAGQAMHFVIVRHSNSSLLVHLCSHRL